MAPEVHHIALSPRVLRNNGRLLFVSLSTKRAFARRDYWVFFSAARKSSEVVSFRDEARDDRSSFIAFFLVDFLPTLKCEKTRCFTMIMAFILNPIENNNVRPRSPIGRRQQQQQQRDVLEN